MKATFRSVGVLLAVALLTSSCAALGLNTSCGGTEVLGIFKQVGDLVPESNVQSSDVKVGSVNKITLDDNDYTAHVDMCLDPGVNIPADSRAVVKETSLLGEKFVSLDPVSEGPPFLKTGDVLGVDKTGKATDLEEVFARLAAVLGTGNLEQINRLTASQAKILRGHTRDLKAVLHQLQGFTGTLASRRHQIASGIDNLDSVANTLLNQSPVLEQFLKSFASSSKVLADQKEELINLLVALNRFATVSTRLLDKTSGGLDKQFTDLRPVLNTVVANATDLKLTLTTLAGFTRLFPQTIPGDYVQLDVCQAAPNNYAQGTDCPQAKGGAATTAGLPAASSKSKPAPSALELILSPPAKAGSR